MKNFTRWAATLAGCALTILGAIPAHADFLYEGFLDPSQKVAIDDYSAWDVFYTPYGSPNYPDISAPSGTYQLASTAGVTPPANSTPINPGAYWNPINPTITQIGTSTAFIIGPGTTGNIYSFAAPTSFQLADTSTYSNGLVLLQMQTEGSLVDFSSIVLQYTNSSGQIITLNAGQYLTEYQAESVSGQGLSVGNRLALEWNLSGLGVTSFNIDFSASAASMSLQEVSLDTSPTYASTVPLGKIWTGTGSGVWSSGANWSGGSPSTENGNVFFNQSGAASVTLDASHTVGQIVFQAPGNVTISPTNGASLTSNTGINTTAAATGTYTINSNYVLGAYNVFDLDAGTVKLNGTVSGNYGIFKQGEGTLELNGNNTFTGSVGLEGGTLRVSGTNTYSGGTSVVWGELVVAGNALNGVAGALGNDTSTISLGADSTLYANQTIPDPASIFIDGNYNVARNIQMAGGTFTKVLGALDASQGATFTGAIGLGTSTDVHVTATAATDHVTFSGGITGGTASGPSAPSKVTLDGLGTVTLSGTNNNYANDTMINSGTLQVAAGSSLTSNGKVTVAAASKLSVDGTLGGSGSLDLHGTLGGTGNVNRTFTVDSTSKLAPGEGVGTLTTVSETWTSGGTLQFNLADALGTQGSGWNFLQINGSLSITATAINVFNIDLASVGLNGLSGMAQNFDSTKDYTWEIAATTGGINGFNASDFVFDTVDVSNSLHGIFSISQNGNDLFLNYTAEAVPEPSTWLMMAIGTGILFFIRKLRTR